MILCRTALKSRVVLFRGFSVTKPPALSRPRVNYETTKRSILYSFPAPVQPYLRLIRFDRPIGSWLLFWPCAWSIALAAEPGCLPSALMLTKFGIGSVIMRGAGCTINDMWDRDIDKEVARTAMRPIACGDISMNQALVFLAGELSLGLAILLSLNEYSIILGVCSIPLIALYPLMKRFTYWPQAFLGLTFNWGALMGYSAIKGYCDWSVCLPLYTSCLAWTLMYDTIYAFQDIDDDRKVGVKSSALRLNYDHAKPWLAGFTSVMAGLLLLVGVQSEQTWPYYLGVATAITHIGWQISTVDLRSPVDCLRKFRSNQHIGMILFLAITAAVIIKHKRQTNTNNTSEE